MKRKTQHRYAPRTENKNATELQGCKLRVAPKILSTVCCKADFYEKRNPQPLLYIGFSICVYVQPYGWVLFFIFYYIIYNI